MTEQSEQKKRRVRGEGSVYFDEKRGRYIAEKIVGYDGRGKPIKRKGSGKSESAALRERDKRVKEYEAGLVVGADHYTVGKAVVDWLEHGQTGNAEKTLQENRDLYRLHLEPHLAGRKLKDLRAEEVDRWLEGLTEALSTSRLKTLHSLLNRSVKRAMARGLVVRNVVDLCKPPKGRAGRPSKSLTTEQALAVVANTRRHRMYPYIIVSLLAGLRTEEVRALRWDRVHLDAVGDLPPHVEVWRAVREGGDTKTKLSRRTLALPSLVVEALREQAAWQEAKRGQAGARWHHSDVVFTTEVGTPMDADNVRRDFRLALELVGGPVATKSDAGGELSVWLRVAVGAAIGTHTVVCKGRAIQVAALLDVAEGPTTTPARPAATSGPTLTLSSPVARPGTKVLVSGSGFPPSTEVVAELIGPDGMPVVSINPADWTPRELRHSFVSLMSKQRVPLEEVARLVGHKSTAVTELVYRHELRPVIQSGAQAMDELFRSGT